MTDPEPPANYDHPHSGWQSNRMRCPRCDSDQCECIVERGSHTHVCGDCGLTETWQHL